MKRQSLAVILAVFWLFVAGVSSVFDHESPDVQDAIKDQKWNCTDMEFECADGTCISLDSRCNFRIDCPLEDDSDEKGCVHEDCTFEGQELCGWTIEPYTEGEEIIFSWETITGKDNPGDHTPPKDHTMGTDEGYYLFPTYHGGEVGVEAITKFITLTPFGGTSESCRLTFWYWLSGDSPGTLHVMRGPYTEEELWMEEGNYGDEWQYATVGTGQLRGMNLSIEAHRGEIYDGAAAIDDLSFQDCQTPIVPFGNDTCGDTLFTCKDGMCTLQEDVCDYSFECQDFSDENPATCLHYKFRCDHELGMCKDWQQDTYDNTNWVRLQASAEIEGTSPKSDHTFRSDEGHYLLLDTLPAYENITAVGRIHSPVLQDTGRGCALRYWYQITGDFDGALNIYARVSYYMGGMREVVHHKSPGEVWYKDRVTFHDYAGGADYQVVIEGVSNTFGLGNVAIDDLSMTPDCELSDDQTLPGQEILTTPAPICPPGQLTCSNGECYYPSDVCNFHNDCSDGTDEQDCAKNCDFETEGDLCGWFESDSSSAHWQRKGFPAEEPGPPTDHRGKANTSVLVSSKTDGTWGKEAVLESPTFSGANKSCVLSVWYYMVNDGDLQSFFYVYLQDETISTELIQDSANITEWKNFEVSLISETSFSLYFRAVMGKGKAYTALDDIAFRNCAADTKQCTSSEFQCIDDLNCIPYYRVCDASPDCHDATDEEGCNLKINEGDCNFDGDSWLEVCEWEQFQDDDLDWIRANHTNSTIMGPMEDHTFGEGGYYIYLGDSSEAGKVASISPKYVYPPSYGICFLRYWYYLHDSTEDIFDLGALRVVLQDEDNYRLKLIIHTNNKPAAWQESILVVTWDKHFRIIFEAETGDVMHTYIALDDVSFTRECVTGVPPTNSTCLPHEFECDNHQCIPQRLHCDFKDDCEDESDEVNCPEPPPVVGCKDTEFDCGEKKTCIPGLLLCDGVNDCPNNADEKECPDGTPCPAGSFYCMDDAEDHPCIDSQYLCDGNISCALYEADESLCGECPDYLCLNDGTCQVSGDKLPSCECATDYWGVRCQSGGSSSDSGLSPGAIAGIVIGCLAFVVIVAGLVYYFVIIKKSSDASGYVMNPFK